MELQGDRQEVSIRLLQNGRYVWTITTNTAPTLQAIEQLKQLDGELRNRFPNHVKETGIRFSEFSDE